MRIVASSITRNRIRALMTKESIFAAKVLATEALAFDLGVLRDVMSSQVVGSSESCRTLFT